MSNVQERVARAKNNKNFKTILNLVANLDRRGEQHRLGPLFYSIFIQKICEIIKSYERAAIMTARNVGIECYQDPKDTRKFFVKFFDKNKNSAEIALVHCAVHYFTDPVTYYELDISFGRTSPNYAKNGKNRPVNNGPGYGTIIRALICAAARKMGVTRVMQTSAYITPSNIQAAREGRLKQPVSAYIMNKLGFNKNETVNASTPMAAHDRILYFKKVNRNVPPNAWPNTPTPALNSVMNSIFRNSSWK